jgi:peptidoglycan hydrolase-like protein with peptidoglycan-binding domain
LKKGLKGNDKEAVSKIQTFLNNYMGNKLKVDGIFGTQTDIALKAFQIKHKDKILDPWGLKGPTGIFYLTTQTEVNNIMCPELNLPIPALTPMALNPLFPKA